MEMISQIPLLQDSAISANWLIAVMLAYLLYQNKRANDKADIRETKIDAILEKQQKQLNQHELKLAVQSERMNDMNINYGESNKKLAEEIINKLRM